jgi:hypothetical protein
LQFIQNSIFFLFQLFCLLFNFISFIKPLLNSRLILLFHKFKIPLFELLLILFNFIFILFNILKGFLIFFYDMLVVLLYSEFDFLLLLFCANELTFIPEMGFLETFKNSALRFCSYIVDYFSILFFLISFILNVVSYHLNLLFFHIINFLYEFLSSL